MYWTRGICNYCHKETNDKSSVCDECYQSKVVPMTKNYENQTSFYAKETILLTDGMKASRAQIDEVERRVILNDNGQTYDVGRRGENGKIQERLPDYA